MKERKAIEEKYKWDLTKFCKDNEEFLDRLNTFEKKSKKIASFEGKLSDDKELLKCLKFEEELAIEADSIGHYVFLKHHEDLRDSKVNELNERIEKVLTDYSVMGSFVDVEVAEFSDEKLKGIINNKKFADYKRHFENVLREKKYVLSKKEEKLLAGMTFCGGFSDNFSKFDNGDLKFNKVKDSKGKEYELNHATYLELLESKDEILRKNTFCEMNGAYGRYINMISNNYISDIKVDCYFSKIRGFKSALEKTMFYEEVSEKVYKTLIKKIHDNIDVMHDYLDIKRKMLGMKKITIADTFAPISKTITKKYTYDEAIELIKKAVAPLGEEYVNLIQRAKDERWIDVYPNTGKQSGAFETAAYGKTPVVLTNFTGDLTSVFTLAHELGHAMHSYFSNERQKFSTADYVIFVAEVASTTNEMLLLRYLLGKAKNDKEKIVYFDKLLSEVRTTIFRQTMFSEFEEKAHDMYEKGIPLSKDVLCETYFDLNKFYFGKKVKIYDETKYEWARIPHFYSAFYVYKYAIGLISALCFSERLFENITGAREKYIDFLSAGSSKDPVSILRDAGCDLEEENIFDYVFNYLREILKSWKKII